MLDLKKKKSHINEFVNSVEYIPMDKRDMAAVLGVPNADIVIFNTLIDKMVNEGTIILTKKRGRIMSASKVGFIRGRFSSTPKGFGFVLRDDGGADLYVSAGSTMGAMHGDIVQCRVVKEGSPNHIAEITEIITRSKATLVGTFEFGEGGGFVTPDDRRMATRVHVPWKNILGAEEGEKVKVQIEKFNETGEVHEGRVLRVLGNPLDIGVDVMSIVEEYDLPHEFPENVLKQAATMPHSVLEHEIEGRLDLRHLPTVTIDGEDTKDIDDAITIEQVGENYRLYVHIADVSHYVAQDSPLWKEALKRATSVYLADRVIPMLPASLSNGICSLNPGVDRLALTCIINLDSTGRALSSEIVKTIIHSDHAITYETLADILTNPDSIHRASYTDCLEMLENMQKLSKELYKKRAKKGALEFEFPECKIAVDADGRVVDVVRREKNVATSIIEEFMICANEAVSTEYFWMDIPFIYRVHEEPAKEKLEALMLALQSHGVSLKKGGGQAKNLQQLLERVKIMPQRAAVSKLILKSLKQAKYMPQALGHFGLAKEYYSHFTSPIRRFPDFMIHTIISDNLAGKVDAGYVERLDEILTDICKHSSENERRADACAEDVAKLKKCQFMFDKIGENFEGKISHTMQSGFFVELESTIEGVVSMGSVTDDYYEYDENRYEFIGRKNKRKFGLGDKVTITVSDVNVELRRIDFELAEFIVE